MYVAKNKRFQRARVQKISAFLLLIAVVAGAALLLQQSLLLGKGPTSYISEAFDSLFKKEATWKATNAVERYSEVAPSKEILEVQLNYTKNRNPSVKITKTERKQGYAPQVIVDEKDTYTLRVLDGKNTVVYTQKFSVDNTISAAPPLNNEEVTKNSITLGSFDFALTIPWSSSYKRVEILDQQQKKLSDNTVDKLSAPTNAPRFYSITGREVASARTISLQPAMTQGIDGGGGGGGSSPYPTPMDTPKPSPTPSVKASPQLTPTPTPYTTIYPSPIASAYPSPSPSPYPTATLYPTIYPTATLYPTTSPSPRTTPTPVNLPPERLDITFIGDNYAAEEMSIFLADVNRAIQKLITFEPFKSRSQEIIFHMVLNTQDLFCTYDTITTRLLYCNESHVISQVNNAGVPYDAIGVIVKSDVYGGAGGSLAVTYNGDLEPQVFVHELGHSLGYLADEYIAYSGEGPMYGSVSRNCYAGQPPAQEWQGRVDIGSYAQGCGYYNWYRSSPESIMLTLSAEYFNRISIDLLNERIDYFTWKVPTPSPYPTSSPTLTPSPTIRPTATPTPTPTPTPSSFIKPKGSPVPRPTRKPGGIPIPSAQPPTY